MRAYKKTYITNHFISNMLCEKMRKIFKTLTNRSRDARKILSVVRSESFFTTTYFFCSASTFCISFSHDSRPRDRVLLSNYSGYRLPSAGNVIWSWNYQESINESAAKAVVFKVSLRLLQILRDTHTERKRERERRIMQIILTQHDMLIRSEINVLIIQQKLYNYIPPLNSV